MKIARRIAIALSSLLAVALAGGAHWRGWYSYRPHSGLK